MRKYGLLLTFALLAVTHATQLKAATITSYTVFNIPSMYLNKGISATATTGITLTAPIRNGDAVSYPALSGGILELKSSRYQEYIYYSTGSLASDLTVTLYGVTRGFCWDTDTFASCEDGRVWSRGTIVTFTNDMRLFNRAAKTDRVNTFSGSGAIRGSSTTIALLRSNYVTTAQRLAMTAANGDEVYDTDLGVKFDFLGGVWVQRGDTGTANASTTISGKTQIGTGSQLINRTGSGTQGQLVLGLHSLTMTGAEKYSGYIPMLNSDGFCSVKLGCTGTGSSWGSGNILLTQGTGAFKEASAVPIGNGGTGLSSAGTKKSLLTASGGVFVLGTPVLCVAKVNGTTHAITSTTSEEVYTDVGYTCPIAADQLSAGDSIGITWGGIMNIAQTNSILIEVQLDTVVVMSGSVLETEGSDTERGTFSGNGMITIDSIGGTGKARGVGMVTHNAADVSPTSLMTGTGQTIDTTQELTLQTSYQASSSSSNNEVVLYNFHVIHYAAP